LEPNDILEANDRDIPDEGTGPLRLHRDNLVEQIISVATEGKRKQVLLRGAAGTGKTSLLTYVGRHLEAQNKRVVIAAVPDMLPKLAELLDQARKGCQEESPEEVQDRPLYLLVDEAQQSYGKGVLHALLKMHADKRNIVIIAAGIPGKEGESSAFKNRIDSDKMLLTETELCEDEEVIQFFSEKLVAALGPGHLPDTTRRATIDVLKFSHYYSAGHAYACLKIAEYCVKYQAEKCIDQHQREELGLALGSEAFLGEVGKGIFKRCFPFFSDYNSVEDLRNKYMSGSTLLVSKLQEHGLWDMTRNCLLSPLLQYHLFRLVPKKDDFVFDSPSKIGHALFHCTRDYKKWKFHQYEATTEGVRERCEDGAGFFIGCELSKYCLVLPQYAIPKAQPTLGRPQSVDYYLNGRLNMFLELVINGSLLDKHFDRFLTGSYGLEKPYAILDINFKTTEPRQLNGKYKELEENYYTYVVQTRALYRGMELFKSGQEAEPPLVTVSFILVSSPFN